MKNSHFFISLIILFSYSSQVANAQITITAATGASFMNGGLVSSNYNSVYKTGNYYPTPPNTYGPPLINIMFEKFVSQHSSIGLAATYEYFTDLPIADYNPLQQEEVVTRYNFGLRYLYRFKCTEKESYGYIGMRVGLSYWQDKIPSGMSKQLGFLEPTTGLSYSAYIPMPSFSPFFWLLPSAQVFWGKRFYLFPSSPTRFSGLGLNIELGIGTPYFAELGLFYKINKNQKVH